MKRTVLIVLIVIITISSPVFGESLLEALQKDLENMSSTEELIEDPAPEPNHKIVIDLGGGKLEKDVINTLDVLKRNHNEYYNFIVSKVDSIVLGDYIASRSWTRTILVQENQWFRHHGIWRASTLVHEATHCNLYWAWMGDHPGQRKPPRNIYSGENAETVCMIKQTEFLQRYLGTRYDSDANRYIEFLDDLISVEGNNHADMDGDGDFDSDDAKLLKELAERDR